MPIIIFSLATECTRAESKTYFLNAIRQFLQLQILWKVLTKSVDISASRFEVMRTDQRVSSFEYLLGRPSVAVVEVEHVSLFSRKVKQ